MAKQSIHRVMADLKTIDDRIERSIGSGTFVKSNKHSNQKIDGMSIDDYKDKVIRASYNQANDLINQRQKLRRVLVLSNAGIDTSNEDQMAALKRYTVDGKDMTMVEILDYERVLDYREQLIRKMNSQLVSEQMTIVRQQQKIEDDYNKYLVAGGFADKNGDSKTDDKEMLNTMYTQFVSTRSYDLIDPLDLTNIIKVEQEKIDSARADIDATKNEANALTVVEV